MRRSTLVAALLFGLASAPWGMSRAETPAVTAAREVYRQQCSKCHGLIVPDAHSHRLPEPSGTLHVRRATARFAGHVPATAETWLAFAPPYGPPLRGVYGRPAGSVASFNYSSAFKQALQGVVWDEQSLDLWLTDSQKRAPGSLMFYRQPEAEIRRQIILYLRANR